MACSICGKEGKYMIKKEGMDEIDYDGTYRKIDGDICSECFIKSKGIKKLYHVSLDPDVCVLKPRVPESRCDNEDNTIPRIST